MPNVIRFLRGDKKDIPRLKAGQPAFTLDTNEFFVGNGTDNIKFLNDTDIKRASEDEAIEGLDNTKLITPKTLKVAIKANGGGGGIINNVFMTGVTNGKFTATEVTDRFTIAGLSEEKEVTIIYKNLILNEDEEYTLSKHTGLVVLTFNLEIGEEVFYEIINTSYDYNDLKNKLEVVDNLTQTESGKALDAKQGKLLNDKITDIKSSVDNIDVSWSGISGKPGTFPPSTHSHDLSTSTQDGYMSKSDKVKLDGIAVGANNYTHPSTHPATMITEDATHRFATDSEKSTWNGKASTAVVTTEANGLMVKEDKTKLDGIAIGANKYVHPNSGVTAGTYPKVTVNAQGHVTGSSSLTVSDIPTLTSDKISDFNTQVRTSGLDQMSAPTNNVSMNNKKITNVSNGTSNTDVVNLGQLNTAINNATSGVSSAIHAPVADLSACKLINASGRMDKMLLNIETLGLYRWDAESKDTDNDKTIIRPTDIANSTAGRWLKMNSSLNEHNTLDNMQGGTTGEYYHLTNAQLTKLNGVATGAQVNQNAFSNIKVGKDTINADSVTDTLELVAGTNITLTPDAVNDKVTIASKDTVYTHPNTAGNKHIPSGGASNQYLKYSADGTATWSGLPIVNNLTTGTSGSILDASQGKILNDNKADKSYVDTQDGELTKQITVLNGSKLDKKAVPIDRTIDLFTLDEGHYVFEGLVPSNKNYPPLIVDNVFKHVTINVYGIKHDSTHGYQVIKVVERFNVEYSTTCAWDEWRPWVTMATTDKTEISFPYSEGYVSRPGYETMITKNSLGEVIFNFTAQRADGTTLPTTEFTLGYLPLGYRPRKHVASPLRLASTTQAIAGTVFINSSNGQVSLNTHGLNSILGSVAITFNTN